MLYSGPDFVGSLEFLHFQSHGGNQRTQGTIACRKLQFDPCQALPISVPAPDYLAAASISPGSGFQTRENTLSCHDRALVSPGENALIRQIVGFSQLDGTRFANPIAWLGFWLMWL
jgi:hypothetical protein